MRSIEEQEMVDRTIIDAIYSQSGISSANMSIICPYDIQSTGDNKVFCTEVKMFSKDFPKHIIKKEKMDRMLEASKGKGLVYAVICSSSNTVYFYNCHKIDWTKIECKPMKQLKSQFNPSKGSYVKDVYFIPKELAFMTRPIPNIIQT